MDGWMMVVGSGWTREGEGAGEVEVNKCACQEIIYDKIRLDKIIFICSCWPGLVLYVGALCAHEILGPPSKLLKIQSYTEPQPIPANRRIPAIQKCQLRELPFTQYFRYPPHITL